jgi:hypothetical protein
MFCNECYNFMDITNTVYENRHTSEEFLSTTEETNNINVFIENVLKGENFEPSLIEHITIEQIHENELFKSLDKNKKTMVINSFLKKTKNKSENLKNKFYFYCNNCGFNTPIKNKTCIYQDKIDIKPINITNYKYDATLPSTKKYVCLNKNCETHTNPGIKKASFFKLNQNSYETTFLCHVCDITWII